MLLMRMPHATSATTRSAVIRIGKHFQTDPDLRTGVNFKIGTVGIGIFQKEATGYLLVKQIPTGGTVQNVPTCTFQTYNFDSKLNI